MAKTRDLSASVCRAAPSAAFSAALAARHALNQRERELVSDEPMMR